MIELFHELQRYVGLTSADADVLRALHPRVQHVFPHVAELFYARVLEHDDARAALARGEKHVGQLKGTLVRWMNELMLGPWDDAYVERRARIGRVHVQIKLPQHYMVSAMNVVRVQLREQACLAAGPGSAECVAAESALEKICDIDLALMLHTYRQDLESSQARAERLSTFGQLVGSIGHELRNPLGVIETSLYVLKQRQAEDERTKKHLDRIGAQVTLANDIITQLLSLIRERPMAKQPVALLELTKEACASLAPSVTVTGEGDLRVDGDPTQLRQVVVNLVQNAQHFATESGRVEVSLEVHEATAVLRVDDSGPGIDPSVRNRLFEPLVTTRAAGIGLGLALVKRIVEKHDGTVSAARSPTLGGARFEVRLPLGKGACRRRRFLLVDDNQAFAENIEEILADLGHEVVRAHDGQSAIDQLEPGRFDVLITDMKMPGVSGAELLKVVRERDPGLPVVLLSAYTRNEQLEQARRLGLLAFVSKTTSTAKLLCLLEAARRDAMVVVMGHDEARIDLLREELSKRGVSVWSVRVPADVGGACPLAAISAPGEEQLMEALKARFPRVPVFDLSEAPEALAGRVEALLSGKLAS